MLVTLLGVLGALLIGLLFIRRLHAMPSTQSASAFSDALAPPNWKSPVVPQQVNVPRQDDEPLTVASATRTRVGPSVGQIAVGVWLGLWLFVVTAATATVLILVLLADSLPSVRR